MTDVTHHAPRPAAEIRICCSSSHLVDLLALPIDLGNPYCAEFLLATNLSGDYRGAHWRLRRLTHRGTYRDLPGIFLTTEAVCDLLLSATDQDASRSDGIWSEHIQPVLIGGALLEDAHPDDDHTVAHLLLLDGTGGGGYLTYADHADDPVLLAHAEATGLPIVCVGNEAAHALIERLPRIDHHGNYVYHDAGCAARERATQDRQDAFSRRLWKWTGDDGLPL